MQAKAEAQSSNEYVKQGLFAGKDIGDILAGLVDEYDNDGALAVPSGQSPPPPPPPPAPSALLVA